jgi:hypothetical protein
MRRAEVRPVKYSMLAAVVFSGGYAVVRHFQLPFEKIIFVVIPLTLNVLPALVFAVQKTVQRPFYVWLSLILYATASTCGFFQPAQQLLWTLTAALMPVAVSILAFFRTLPKQEVED